MCSSSDAEDTKIQSSKNGRSWLNEKAEISEENLVRSDELPPRKEPAGPAGRDVLRWRQQPPPGAIHGTTGFCRACKNGWLGFEVIRGKILLPSQRALETVRLTHRQTDYFEAKDSFSAIVLRGYHCLWFQGKQSDIPGILFAGVCAHWLLCTDNSCFGCLQFHLYHHCKSLLWFKAQHRARRSARGTVKALPQQNSPLPKFIRYKNIQCRYRKQIWDLDAGNYGNVWKVLRQPPKWKSSHESQMRKILPCRWFLEIH